MSGVLIAFEGIEGSGKSTQAKKIYNFLKQNKIPTILTYEPGGTSIGNQIRDILLSTKNRNMYNKTELLLYLASRAQHVYEKIIPELAKGKVIITDRFSLSSMAYQGAARGISYKIVYQFNKFAANGIDPDLTILVDLPVKIGMARKINRTNKNLDRIEKEKIEFHQKIRDAYIYLAQKSPKKILIFSGIEDENILFNKIKDKVVNFLSKKGLWR